MKKPIVFLSGFVESKEVARVIAQDPALNAAGLNHSFLLRWTRTDGRWVRFNLDWTANRMWMMGLPTPTLFATGPIGRVCLLTSEGATEEDIDTSNTGPIGRGPIRDLRGIGKSVFACGMARQVYRRIAPKQWAHVDAGTVLPLGAISQAGFNSIDGNSEDEIYAVGFLGEIWHWSEQRWTAISSPTNRILHRVRVLSRDQIFAGGQSGVLLKGSRDGWEEIRHDATSDHLWGMEWFLESLYVASDSAVYRLRGEDDLESIPMAADFTAGHLHARDGVLWSFGSRHVTWTEDGYSWNDVTP